jgi:hypothetical protein
VAIIKQCVFFQRSPEASGEVQLVDVDELSDVRGKMEVGWCLICDQGHPCTGPKSLACRVPLRKELGPQVVPA